MKIHKHPLFTPLLCLGTLFGTAASQSPSLVRDFDPGSTLSAGDSNPTGFTVFAGEVYFSATTVARGSELYKLPPGATQPVLVKDIVPGPNSSSPGPFEAFQSAIYFGRGEELWSSDGTEPGTVLVATLGSEIVQLTSDGPSLFFRTSAGEMFVSDGTTAGTRAITPSGTLVEIDFAVAGGAAYFVVRNFVQLRLWTIDSPNGQARLVTTRLQNPFQLATAGNRVIIATRTTTGDRLWSSDGTDPGTIQLSTQTLMSLGFNLGTRHLFTGFENSEPTLFETDGTLTGTQRIATLPRSALGPLDGVDAGRLGYFTFRFVGLFVTDGTAAGTMQISNNPARNIAVLRQDTVVFAGFTKAEGEELFVSNGTVSGTVLVRDIQPGPVGSRIGELTGIGSGLAVFRGRDPVLGTEVMRTDGTLTGTRTLGEIQPTQRVPRSGDPVTHAESLGIATVTERASAKIYLTDATAIGTSSALDGQLGGMSSLGGENYILLNANSSFELHRVVVGGTTQLVSQGNQAPAIAGIHRAGKRMVFIAFSGPSRLALWSSDGTDQGTAPIRLPGGDDLYTIRLFPVGDRVLATGYPSSQTGGFSTYITDGTSAGTIQLLSGTAAYDVTQLGDRIIINTATGLAISDGTAAGTRMIKSAALGRIGTFVTMGQTVYFQGFAVSDWGLWKTDGTDQGTVKIIGSGSLSASTPTPLGAAGGRMIFRYGTPAAGIELWSTDGTTAGTALLRDIEPGTAGQAFIAGQHLVVGDYLYFRAYTSLSGHELWVTDGTTAGTHRVVDIVPGPGGSSPSDLALVNGQLLFSAYSPSAGRELFALEIGAHTQQIGFGCASGLQPRIEATPPALGGTMSLRLNHPPAARQQAVLLFGEIAVNRTPWPGHCAIYVDLIHFTTARPLMLDSRGETVTQLNIPNVPSLHGMGICAQAGIASSSSPLGLDLTPGLRLELRR